MKIFNRLHLRYSITIILFLLTYYGTNAQSSFAKVFYDDNYPTEVYSIVETGDSAYIMVGYYADKPLVFKIDTLGNIVWSKTIGTAGSFFDVIRTYDSAFVLAGKAYNISSSDFLCVKINSSGDTVWSKEYDFSGHDILYNIEQTLDDGYILTGFSSSSPVTFEYLFDYIVPSKIVLVKIDSIGNLEWVTEISACNYLNQSCSVKQAPDSSFVVTGCISDSIYPYHNMRFVLLKLSSEGNVLWFKKHNWTQNYYSRGYDIISNNTGYFLTAYMSNESICFIQTDMDGNILSTDYIYGYLTGKTYLRSQLTDNNDKIVTLDGIIILDSLNNIVFNKKYMLESFNEAIPTFDNGYIIIGGGPIMLSKYPFLQTGFIKTDYQGNTPECQSGEDITPVTQTTMSLIDTSFSQTFIGSVIINSHPVQPIIISDRYGCVDISGSSPKNNLNPAYTISPNPSGGIFQITLNDQVAGISEVDIYNSLGTKVMYKVMEGNNDIFIDMRARPKGIYYLRLTINNIPNSEKIVID